MRKLAWTPGAAGLAIAGALACGGTETGGTTSGFSDAADRDHVDGDRAFPFSGPACMGGPPGTSSANLACSQCEEDACSGPFACIAGACADFFTCACACPMSDCA